ncbi:MAG: hypothetical protein ACRD5B_00095 [Nitrososphaeraceae archaeon]
MNPTDLAIQLTKQRDEMIDTWFQSLSIGDKVYNYSLKWENKQIVDKKLREGIIKEIHDSGRFDRHVIVDNLTTGRQNKWGDYDLVRPQEIEDIQELLQQAQILSNAPVVATQEKIEVIDDSKVKAKYKQLLDNASELLEDDDICLGKCQGIYGAFNKSTGECVYIGKSKSVIAKRWQEHRRFWKKLRPIHRQPLLTQYLHFFGEQIEWKVLLPLTDDIDNDLVEYCERRIFEEYKPIANTIIPNGTIFGRSILEGEGDSIAIQEWNPYMVEIRISKGQFLKFSDDKTHFTTSNIKATS